MAACTITVPATFADEYVARLIGFSEEIERLDGVRVPESLGTLGSDPLAFVVEATIEGSLVGIASASGYYPPEVGIAVHPDQRRTGVARALADAVREVLLGRGLNDALLINEGRSINGRHFLEAVGAEYRFSEYRLEFDSAVQPVLESSDLVQVRKASQGDQQILVSILSRSFDEPPGETAITVESDSKETNRWFVIASIEGIDFGSVRIGEWSGIGDITGLAVLPEFRGKGLGRKLLHWAVSELVAQGFARIALEVSTGNTNALGLYQSSGFSVTNEFAYYGFPMIPRSNSD